MSIVAIRSKSAIVSNFRRTSFAAAKGYTKCVTFLNVSIIIVCTSVLIWQAKECLWRYLQWDTKTIMSVQFTGDATFLAFTVCPSFEAAYKSGQFQRLGTSKENYMKGNFTTNSSALFDQSQWLNVVSYNLTEILQQVIISTADGKRPKIAIDWTSKEANEVLFITTKYDKTFGRCYSMEILPNVTALGLTKIEFIAKLNIYIYLHHPGQYMDVDSKSKVQAIVGKVYFLDLVYEISDNTLGKEGNMPCSSSMNFTLDNCVYQKLNEKLMDTYNCTMPYVPSEYPVCEYSSNTQDIVADYEYYSNTGQKSLCELPCSTMEVFLGLPFDGPRNDSSAYIKLYIKSTVKVKRTVYDYTVLSLIAEIGGYTGLLLGVSVVNLTSLFDSLAFRFLK